MTTTPTSYTLERLLREIDDHRFRPQNVRDAWQRVEAVKKEFDEEDQGIAWLMRIPLSVLFSEFEM